MDLVNAQDLVNTGAVVAALKARYGLGDDVTALASREQLPGESRADWKARTLALHYGMGTDRVTAQILASASPAQYAAADAALAASTSARLLPESTPKGRTMNETPAETLPTTDERRAALTKALRKYRGDGYSVTLSADGLSATLTRRRKVNGLVVLVLTLFTIVGGLIYFLNVRRKTDSVVLFVDDRGRVVKS